MVLWFFFVFFRNCFKLPEDMYSVMKITCRGRRRCYPLLHRVLTRRTARKHHRSFALLTLALFSFTSAQYL